MLEEMHDPVLSQPICQVGSEPPLLSSEKNFVHGHFSYLYNVAQYYLSHSYTAYYGPAEDHA